MKRTFCLLAAGWLFSSLTSVAVDRVLPLELPGGWKIHQRTVVPVASRDALSPGERGAVASGRGMGGRDVGARLGGGVAG